MRIMTLFSTLLIASFCATSFAASDEIPKCPKTKKESTAAQKIQKTTPAKKKTETTE